MSMIVIKLGNPKNGASTSINIPPKKSKARFEQFIRNSLKPTQITNNNALR